MRLRLITLLCVSTMLLAACANIGSKESASTTEEERPVNCVDFASMPTSYGTLINNVWNKQAAGNFRWRQCLEQRVVQAKAQYGWSWNWTPNSYNVLAYPEIVVGAKPWDPGPGNDKRFPRKASDTKRLLISYEVETSAKGAYNLATSVWLIRAPQVSDPPDTSVITNEIMIWTESTPASFRPGGVKRDEIEIDGREWEVWVGENWGDGSGVNANRWTYVTYRAKNPTQSASYDARKMIADVIKRGLATPDLYIANVELGNEIMSGSGQTWLRSFSVTID